MHQQSVCDAHGPLNATYFLVDGPARSSVVEGSMIDDFGDGGGTNYVHHDC